jgi:glycosyltransferase involved in cell wall biosynthesis
MPDANVVFMGNLTYPDGMAPTRRFQHFIDGVRSDASVTAQILLLRQSQPGRDDARLDGEHRGVRYTTIGHDIGSGPGVVPAALRYLWRGVAFLARARRRGVANVVYHYNEPSIESVAFLVAASLMGYAVVVDIVEDFHLIGEDARLLSRLKQWSGRWITRHLEWFVDGIVVISSYLEDKLVRAVRGRLPVVLVPVSVELVRIGGSTAAFHRPVRILYAGNFGDKDGVGNLLDAFDAVAARRSDVEFVLSGIGVASRMAEVRERVARSPHASRIRLTGFLADEDYVELLAGCDIPVGVRVKSEFASRGFPFKLGEYLASGRPVLASRVSDIEAFLADRVNAVLVEPGSTSAIVEGLEWVLADEARALAIGRAGRAVAERNFNARTNGRRLLGLIALAGGG